MDWLFYACQQYLSPFLVELFTDLLSPRVPWQLGCPQVWFTKASITCILEHGQTNGPIMNRRIALGTRTRKRVETMLTVTRNLGYFCSFSL